MKYKNLNLKYALINATFMMLVCATAGYAYNFLHRAGSRTELSALSSRSSASAA